MFTGNIDYRRLARFILSVIAGLIVLAATHGAVWAEAHTFILPASSDFGAADCLGKEQGCAEVVASAFCESRGYSDPVAYGRAGDMTGAIPATVASLKPPTIDPDAYVVSCGE